MSRAPQASSRVRWTFTIQHKLLALMLVPLVSIVVGLVIYFPARHLQALQSNLEQRASAYATLVSEQVRSAVAFNDKETAREAFAAVAQDPTVTSVVLYTQQGDVLFERGKASAAARAVRRGVQNPHVFVLDGFMLATAPVRSLEGPRGTLAIELSTAELERSRREVRASALALGLSVLGLGMLAAFFIARSFAGRLRALADAAARVAGGDLDVQAVASASSDEIGVLTTAFNIMVERLRALIEHVQATARAETTRLEQMVQVRTHELHSRNADMRLVLDTMGQGFVTIDRDARMSVERSAILEAWLGPSGEAATLWDYIAPPASDLHEYLALGWSEVTAGVLPLELALAQMPSRFEAGGRFLDLDYRPIGRDGDHFERMLVVISDITARVERERAEADEHEMSALLGHLMRDRTGFLQFMSEARELVDLLCADTVPPDAQLRAAHTLKGNASLFGAQSIASMCHVLEENLHADDAACAQHKRELRARMTLLASKLDAVVGDQRDDVLEIDVKEHRALLDAIDGGAGTAAVRAQVASWTLESMTQRLERIRGQIHGLANRLGKGEIDVVVEHNHARFDGERLSEFWAAFAHAVRNAVDHGIEPEAERERLGKPRRAEIRLRTLSTASEELVQLDDDGRGIDWDAVRRRAGERGRPNATRQDLIDALVEGGLSTRGAVTEISGRGVGLSALHAACAALGGRMSIDSQPGRFTRLTFRWPNAKTRPASAAALRQLSSVGGMR